MHKEADELPAAELFKTISSQRASEMKCDSHFVTVAFEVHFGAHALDFCLRLEV